MKKFNLVTFIVAFMVAMFIMASPCLAAYPRIMLTIDSKIATIDGVEKSMSKAPYVSKEGRTMVHLSFVATTFGYTVNWDNNLKKITVYDADKTVELVVGAMTALVNGEERKLDAPAVISEGYVMVPIRFVSEVMGYSVYYNSSNKTITIQNIDAMPRTIGSELNLSATDNNNTTTTTPTETVVEELNGIWSAAYDSVTYGDTNDLYVVVSKHNVSMKGHSIVINSPVIFAGPNTRYNTTANTLLNNDLKAIVDNYISEAEKTNAKSGTLNVTQSVYVKGDIVSIYTIEYYATTATSGTVVKVITRTFDMRSGKVLALKDLFRAGVDYQNILITKIKSMLTGVAPYVDGNLAANLSQVDKYHLGQNGIFLVYEQNEIGSSTFDTNEIEVSYKELQSYMDANYFNMLTK